MLAKWKQNNCRWNINVKSTTPQKAGDKYYKKQQLEVATKYFSFDKKRRRFEILIAAQNTHTGFK